MLWIFRTRKRTQQQPWSLVAWGKIDLEPSKPRRFFSFQYFIDRAKSSGSVTTQKIWRGHCSMMEACRELAAAEISGACSALQRGLAAAADLHLNVRCEEETFHLTIVTQSGVCSQLSPVSVPAPVTRDPSAAPAPASAGAGVVKATGRGAGKI